VERDARSATPVVRDGVLVHNATNGHRAGNRLLLRTCNGSRVAARANGNDEGERQKRRGWSRSMRRASVKQLLHAYTVAAQLLQQFPGETP
jgi:hypothetical protein